MKKYVWIFFYFFMVTPVFSSEIVRELQSKYNKIKTIDAKFSQNITHKESGSRETRQGVFYFKKPLLVRWEAVKPDPELLIVNETTVWNVFPDEEVAYKYAPAVVRDTYNIFSIISGSAQLTENFYIEEQAKEQEGIKLHLIPKEPVQSLVEAYFWVDPQTKLINKFRIIDFYGNSNDVTFRNYKLDVNISNKIFSYTPDKKKFIIEDRSKNPNTVDQGMF